MHCLLDATVPEGFIVFWELIVLWGRDALVAFPIGSNPPTGRPSPMPEHERLPHLTPLTRHPIVYLTVVAFERRPILASEAAHDVLRNIRSQARSIDGWAVGRYVTMPDHIHLFGRAAQDAKPLSKWMQSWKSLSSRQLITALHVSSPIWQKDYFDRFLRSADNYAEKWNYVLENPVRKGLVREATDWRWQGVLEDLSF